MSVDLWLLYAITCIGLTLTPGPNGLLALSHGVIHGLRRSVFTIIGGCVGFVVLIAVSMAGMSALLSASQLAFVLAKWIGAGYLVYLGFKIWRSAPPRPVITHDADIDIAPASALLRQGFLVAVSNPKGIIFFAALLPQFVDPQASHLIQFLILAATFAGIEFLYEISLAGSAQKLTPWLGRTGVGRWFNRITGATFIGIGGFLATVSRN
jgi:homoserine/homoserine lactone efflux protein